MDFSHEIFKNKIQAKMIAKHPSHVQGFVPHEIYHSKYTPENEHGRQGRQ